jgi:hypothetical protein
MRAKKCISIYVTPHLYSIIKSRAEKGMRSMGKEVLYCLRGCYQGEESGESKESKESKVDRDQDKWNEIINKVTKKEN